MFALAIMATGLCAGCGPVEYINQVTRRASSSVAAAKAAGADKTALYEYTLAVLYLRQARVEAGHAHYQVAVNYGRLAERRANDARALAIDRSTGGTDPDAIEGATSPDGVPVPGEEKMPDSIGDDDDELPKNLRPDNQDETP
jgi:Domain of unknown function (DUF4398)